MMGIETFNMCLLGMCGMALIVFIALYFIDAGYGMMLTKKWGITVDNKLGWILMEAPAFITVVVLAAFADREPNVVRIVMLSLFCIHYFQRTFIFPLLMRGKGRMPITIMLMGVTFNLINGAIQSYWLFYLSPEDMYMSDWFTSPQFIIGLVVFIVGMCINLHSDHVIRNLRKPGDSAHYLPKKGFYKYVTSANYFGELTEWIGWAIMTWSFAGAVFAIWTAANLIPRANSINKKYWKEFEDEMKVLKPKRVIPFIY